VLPLLEARIRKALAGRDLLPTSTLPASLAERTELVQGLVDCGRLTPPQAKKLLELP